MAKGTDPVQFTRESAKRIAHVVRRVEKMPRGPQAKRRHRHGGPQQHRRATLSTTLSYRGTATAAVLEPAPSDTETGEVITVTDAMLNSGDSVSSGSIVLVSKVAGKWVPYSWACP